MWLIVFASLFVRIDEVNSLLHRKLVDLESTPWNKPGSAVSAALDTLRQACIELFNELNTSSTLIKNVFARLGELKLTPVAVFCPMDGIKPNWADIDRIRVKQPLSTISRNFVTFMACKQLPINNDVFRFLQSPSEHANALIISRKVFLAGELQAILDFFVLASHPLVYGRSNRNTLVRSMVKSLYREEAGDILNSGAERNNKLLHSVHILRITECDLSDRDCNALAMRLALFTNLHTLSLHDNIITSSGATAIATALWSNPMQLRILSLENNRIGTEGALSLSRVLPRCKQLMSLGLSGNPIGNIGAYFILKSLLNKFRQAADMMPKPFALIGSEYEHASDDEEEDELDEDIKDTKPGEEEEGLDKMTVTTPTITSRASSVSDDNMNTLREKEREKERERAKKKALVGRADSVIDKAAALYDEDEDDAFSVSETSVYSEGSHIPRKPPNFRALMLQQTALALYGNAKRSLWREKFAIIRVKLFAVIAFKKFGNRGHQLGRLLLANCDLSDETAIMMQFVGMDNTYLTDIDVSGNKEMGDKAAESFAKLVLTGSLTTLKMNACGLTDIGVQTLTHAACKQPVAASSSSAGVANSSSKNSPAPSIQAGTITAVSSGLQTLEVSRNHAGPTSISWVAACANQYTLDALSLSAGFRTVLEIRDKQLGGNSSADNDKNNAGGGNNWDLWQSAEDVADEIAEFYGGGFSDHDNDFEGDEDDDDEYGEEMSEQEAVGHL
jgi:alkanesulfonate monooxygenase SsuD/methylene tetrahydromethanopterin reductase-like flavin-dependent oxidoreductase (luciferase family)